MINRVFIGIAVVTTLGIVASSVSKILTLKQEELANQPKIEVIAKKIAGVNITWFERRFKDGEMRLCGFSEFTEYQPKCGPWGEPGKLPE